MTPLSPRTHLNNLMDQCYPDTDWSDYDELMNAIKRGCKSAANRLLDDGCRVVRPGTLNTPLHLAVERSGWSHVVKRLLERGARVDFRNAENNTALHQAFLCEAPDACINHMVLSYLRETNENLVNNDGLTFLHIASARSKFPYVKELLRRMDVNVDAQVRMDAKAAYAGYTPLHFAVEYGKVEVAACLLKNNASVYVQDANGTTPLHLACYRRNADMIDLLLEYDRVYINIFDQLGTSHFMAACMSSQSEFPKNYLKVAYHRYNVSPITLVNERMLDSPVYLFPGYTPLHFAAELGRLETVKVLLTYGAFCCALSGQGETPFMLASKNKHTMVCDVLRMHCENYQAQMSQSTSGYSGPSTPEKEASDESESSSPDTAYSSAPRSCETVIDLSPSRCQYNSNYDSEAYHLRCMGYSV